MKRMRKVLRNVRDERGFTLVELLMVMVIIGVLAGLGFAGMNMLQRRTAQTQADTNWRALDSAMTMYMIENVGATPAPTAVQLLGAEAASWVGLPEDFKAVPLDSEDKPNEFNPGTGVKAVYYYIDDNGVSVWQANGKDAYPSQYNVHLVEANNPNESGDSGGGGN